MRKTIEAYFTPLCAVIAAGIVIELSRGLGLGVDGYKLAAALLGYYAVRKIVELVLRKLLSNGPRPNQGADEPSRHA